MKNIKKFKKNYLIHSLKKNQDYGNDNLDTFGKIGIMIRLQDKINRYHISLQEFRPT